MPSNIPTTFVSYARADAEFALRLGSDLQSVGASIWLDQLNIAGGQRWDHAVQQALEACQRLLVVLSRASVDSVNVMDEVAFALERKKQVLPVLYQSCRIPLRLVRVQYIDFTANYDDGLSQLVAQLKIHESGQKVHAQQNRDKTEEKRRVEQPKYKRRGKAKFTDKNDHNPLVLQDCPACGGSGKKMGKHRDKKCKVCNGTGTTGEIEPYFENDAPAMYAAPNAYGWIECPKCGGRFLPTDESAWTGRRHKCSGGIAGPLCGQKIIISE